jgi:dihydrofolate reductase
MKHFKAIAAMSDNRVIGNRNSIPWHLPEDFQWFKRMTIGHVLVMGRKTFESIGRPLPGRETIILSRSGFSHPGVKTACDLAEVERLGDAREIFICGGAQIYELTLPLCSDLYLTRVKKTCEGDAFFPRFEDIFVRVATIRETPEFIIEHHRHRELLPSL